MLELRLRYNLPDSGVAIALALRGVADDELTPATAAHVFWRWYDDAAMLPEFLGSGVPGQQLAVPFPNPDARAVLLYITGRTETGVESVTNLDDAEQFVFTPTPTPEAAYETAVASETLTRGMLVDLYDDSGTLKARKADATDNTRFADAFVDADAAISDSVRVYFGGGVIRGLAGLTQGQTLFLSETAGGVTHTSPSGTGKISQIIGTALGPTSAVFDPQEPIELA
jgi:hypothetical protein